ncbi:hypothetical protein DDB_G0288153 [Dictyostelium discoideum AX4]|uniref:Thioredoxin domain-containing protein n=1 Tax=Dictyostelium discoideum TaxID=44689 RepID=Q54JC3_DICDI|nr:hypothetical protein DDB_G0288153 [Dictyostelium discoideum AX4]EAL63364.1 hypothetical protein DDB_G0288153 [Dictyostelium discoideum AX4]|eukprot:XP_636870.1 hypothetical protein DDB_G0288153 [Dictyostelium discoideum AX4]
MAIIEIKNIQEFEKYKNNLNLFLIITGEKDDMRSITKDILASEKEYENVLFLIFDVKKCKDIQICQTVSSTPTFIISSNGNELERYSGVNIDSILSLVKKISDYKVIR